MKQIYAKLSHESVNGNYFGARTDYECHFLVLHIHLNSERLHQSAQGRYVFTRFQRNLRGTWRAGKVAS